MNLLSIIKLTTLNSFRQSFHATLEQLNKDYPYLPSKISYLLSISLCIAQIIFTLIASITISTALLLSNHSFLSLYILIYLYTLKNLITRFETFNSKTVERISFIRYSGNKYLYTLFKIYSPIHIAPILIFLLCFFIKIILLRDINLIFLTISCILIIHFIMYRIEIFFTFFSLVNTLFVMYILQKLSIRVDWTNILEMSKFVKDNSSIILTLNWDVLFSNYCITIFIATVTFLLTSILTRSIRHKNNVKKLVRNSTYTNKKYPKDLTIYLNYSNSLSLNRKISFLIPLSPMVIISIPLFVDIPSRKYIFIIFTGIIICLYTKRFMYRYAYLFHYFANKKEKQLFQFSFKNLFQILLSKLFILFLNQIALYIYLYLIFIVSFWNEFGLSDLIMLTYVCLISLLLALTEKKFIIFDFQSLKMNKDDDYGGTLELLYSMCLFIMALTQIGLEVKGINANVSFIMIIIISIFFLYSIIKVYINLKIWREVL